MKFNLSNPTEITRAKEALGKLIVDSKTVDIKEVKPRRSLNQNAYLHVLLGGFGVFTGSTIEEAKTLYKMLPGNKEIYHYTKEIGGRQFDFLRSSADLDKPTMTKTIETLREWSAKMGYPLPSADEREWLMSIENETEAHERYL